MKVIDRLFDRLQDIFPYKWEAQFSGDKHKQHVKMEWASGLAGLDKFQIGFGIEQVKKHCTEFLVSIPEFRAACFGKYVMPTVDDAYIAAVRADFSNPVVKLVYNEIGSWNFSNWSERDVRKKFDHIYGEYLRNPESAFLKLEEKKENEIKSPRLIDNDGQATTALHDKDKLNLPLKDLENSAKENIGLSQKCSIVDCEVVTRLKFGEKFYCGHHIVGAVNMIKKLST